MVESAAAFRDGGGVGGGGTGSEPSGGSRPVGENGQGVLGEFHGADSELRTPYRLAFVRVLLGLGEHEQAQSHIEVLLEQAKGEDVETRLLYADIRQEMAKLALAKGEL